MTASMTYDGLLFSEDDGVEIAITFTHGALYIGIKNGFDEEVEEAIGEVDARTLLSYLKEKLGDD